MFPIKRLAVLLIALMAAISANALEITGAVYGQDGNAVAGAAVSAYIPTTNTKLAEATTDKDGAFVLKELPEGVVYLETSGRELYALAGDDLTINIWAEDRDEEELPGAPPGDRSVRGIVRLDGKPLANAPVWFHPNGNELVTPVYALSNAQGEFRRDGLAPRPWIVSIEPALEPRVRKVLPPGEEHPLLVDLTNAMEGTSTIELVSGPFIRGRVVDADGKPVARTRVQVIEATSTPLDVFLGNTYRTDASGHFAFPAPEWPADTEVCVVVLDPQQSPVRSKTFPIGANDQSVVITLPRFDEVRVRITERSGKPVRKARLAFVSAADTGGAAALAEKTVPVGDSGELTLRLVAGLYDFYAAAEDFQARRWNVQSAPKIDVILEREALVRGRVHRGDDAIAGVEITVDGSAQKVVTGEDGTFEIKGLWAGKHQLELSKYEEWLSRTMEVEAPGNVDVALPMMGTLRVHIVDAESGAPMGELAFNIESSVESNVETSEGGASMQGFATPQEGTFDMDVPVGSYEVQFVAEEYRPSPAREFRIDKGRVTAIEVRLARGITVKGRVVDESGNGVADAFIGVSREKEDLPLQAITGEDGTFTVKSVERGTPAVFSVRKDGYLPFQKTIETQNAQVLDVRLSRGLGLQGIVLFEGKPVYGATIRADTVAAGMSQAQTTTGEDGRFALTGLVDARYTVSATMPEGRTVLENVEPAARKEIVLALDPTPRGVIYGTVGGIPRDLPGTIVHRTVVAYTPNDGAEATIDESGNYRMENTPSGMVRLWARIESSAESYRLSTEKHVDVPSGGELRVDLQFGGEVHVTGRVTYDHKPVVDASVLFAGPEDSTMTARTKGEGMYDVLLPVEGPYEITVSANQIPTFTVRRDVRGGARLDLDLQQNTIEGLVIDAATRQPIANARIAFGDEDHVFLGVDTRTTDAGGRFRMEVQDLWHVYATAPGYAPKAAAVQSGQTVVIALEPAAELQVRVTDARSGAPLEMQFHLQDERGTFVYADPERSADRTTYRFSLSPSTKYTLTITADGYETKILQVTAPGNLNVTMQ